MEVICRKLKSTIDEYITRVGQQAIVLCCLPGKSNQSTSSYKVFGSQPLETVVSVCVLVEMFFLLHLLVYLATVLKCKIFN